MSDLFLSDDPAPRRSRPRWVDGLGLAAVVLGIVAIGALGDRGSPGRSPAPTTTTSTTSAFRRGRPYASTTTVLEPSTTSTTLVQQLDGHIAVPTGAAVLIAAGSTLTLVDVDAGTARRLPASAGFGLVGLDDGFIVPAGGALRLVPTDGGPLVDLALPEPTFESRLMRAGPHSVWVFSGPDPNTTTMTEVSASGRPTGGHVELPRGVYVVGAVDGGVVANARGSIVFVDGRTGKARSLGTGEVIAARGRSIVRVSCVLLRCRTEVVDVATGRARLVPVPDVSGYARQSELSPDGRWLAISYDDQTDGQHLLVVDLRIRQFWTSDVIDSQASIAFSPRSDVVFSTSAGSLCAFDLTTSNHSCLDGIQAGQVGEIAAAPVR